MKFYQSALYQVHDAFDLLFNSVFQMLGINSINSDLIVNFPCNIWQSSLKSIKLS